MNKEIVILQDHFSLHPFFFLEISNYVEILHFCWEFAEIINNSFEINSVFDLIPLNHCFDGK